MRKNMAKTKSQAREDAAFKKSIGERLKMARMQLEQAKPGTKVVDALGVSRQTWYNWEAGLRHFDPLTIRRFADEYDISIDWLYGRPTTMTFNAHSGTERKRSEK
jgi:transcriptional regulator with XRE-family HTH domain